MKMSGRTWRGLAAAAAVVSSSSRAAASTGLPPEPRRTSASPGRPQLASRARRRRDRQERAGFCPLIGLVKLTAKQFVVLPSALDPVPVSFFKNVDDQRPGLDHCAMLDTSWN